MRTEKNHSIKVFIKHKLLSYFFFLRDFFYIQVARLSCTSEIHEVEMLLDINVDIYSVKLNDKFSVLLASSISLDPEVDDIGEFTQNVESTLAADYEYVMYGKVFRYNFEPP